MNKRWIIAGIVLYVVLAAVIFPFFIGVPWQFMFTGDAAGYSTGARNLLASGFYTFDGVHAFMDREPVMSFFLLPLYFLFGAEQPIALTVAQSFVLIASSWFFCSRFAAVSGSRAAGIAFLLILTSGSVLHTVYSAYRECLVLSLLLLLSGLSLRPSTLKSSVLMGITLGLLILAYYSFVFLPLFLIVVWMMEGRPLRHTAITVVVAAVLVSGWALRNMSYDGRFRVIDNRRTAVMWYVRGEQAERIRGMEPFWCLWAEYVSRSWEGRSDACSYNGLMNTHWSEGFDLQADYSDTAAAGKAKIIAHFPWYLWFSVFEIIELHLPFLGGGWSTAYNMYAAFTQLLLAIGCFLALPALGQRKLWGVLVFAVYNTLVFILTDATPRYLLPVFFVYAALAGIGYDSVLRALRKPRS